MSDGVRVVQPFILSSIITSRPLQVFTYGEVSETTLKFPVLCREQGYLSVTVLLLTRGYQIAAHLVRFPVGSIMQMQILVIKTQQSVYNLNSLVGMFFC